MQPMEICGFPQTVAWAIDFLSEVHPSRATLQPCLDGPARQSRLRESYGCTLTLLRYFKSQSSVSTVGQNNVLRAS